MNATGLKIGTVPRDAESLKGGFGKGCVSYFCLAVGSFTFAVPFLTPIGGRRLTYRNTPDLDPSTYDMPLQVLVCSFCVLGSEDSTVGCGGAGLQTARRRGGCITQRRTSRPSPWGANGQSGFQLAAPGVQPWPQVSGAVASAGLGPDGGSAWGGTPCWRAAQSKR